MEAFVCLVVKGGMRFGRMADRREQKAILEQLFAEVFFRPESITAFRFRQSLVAGSDAFAGGAPAGRGERQHARAPFCRVPPPTARKRCDSVRIVRSLQTPVRCVRDQ